MLLTGSVLSLLHNMVLQACSVTEAWKWTWQHSPRRVAFGAAQCICTIQLNTIVQPQATHITLHHHKLTLRQIHWTPHYIYTQTPVHLDQMMIISLTILRNRKRGAMLLWTTHADGICHVQYISQKYSNFFPNEPHFPRNRTPSQQFPTLHPQPLPPLPTKKQPYNTAGPWRVVNAVDSKKHNTTFLL